MYYLGRSVEGPDLPLRMISISSSRHQCTVPSRHHHSLIGFFSGCRPGPYRCCPSNTPIGPIIRILIAMPKSPDEYLMPLTVALPNSLNTRQASVGDLIRKLFPPEQLGRVILTKLRETLPPVYILNNRTVLSEYEADRPR
jgi:hypothetical protein